MSKLIALLAILLLAGPASAQYVPRSGARWPSAILATPNVTGGTITGSTLSNVTESNGVNPVVPTCPVANCPTTAAAGAGGPVLSTQWIYGVTTRDATRSEWESSINLYIGTGKGKGQKVAQYIGAMQGPGAGSGWALNTDIVRGACPGGVNSLYGQPGSGTPYNTSGCATANNTIGADSTIGYELDITNWDADQTTSGAFIVGQYINIGPGSFPIGAGISFGATSGTSAATSGMHHGIEFAPWSVEDYTLYDVSNSSYGYQTGGTHSQAAFADSSTGARSIIITGTKAGESILDASTSPAFLHTTTAHSAGTYVDSGGSPYSISISGSHASSAIQDTSTTPAALNLAGTYSLTAITTGTSTATYAMTVKDGQFICFSGTTACFQHTAGKLYYEQGGGPLMSIADNTGNVVFKGTVTASGSP